VLGFTRAEISYILLGELGLLTLVAIPLGFGVGRGICALFVNGARSSFTAYPSSSTVHLRLRGHGGADFAAPVGMADAAQAGSAGSDRCAQEPGLNHDHAQTPRVDAVGVGDRGRAGLWLLAPTVVGGDGGRCRQPLRVTVEAEGKTRIIDRYVLSAPVAAPCAASNWTWATRSSAPGAADDRIRCPRKCSIRAVRPRAEARVAASEASLQAAQETMAATQAEADYARLAFERMTALCQRQCVVTKDERDRAESAPVRPRPNCAPPGSPWRWRGTKWRRPRPRCVIRRRSRRRGAGIRRDPRAGGRSGARPPAPERGHRGGRRGATGVGDPAHWKSRWMLLSADAVRIRPGTPVMLERWGGEQPLEG